MGDVHGDMLAAAYAHAHVSLVSFFQCYLLALFRISLPMRGVVRLSLILDHIQSIPYYVLRSIVRVTRNVGTLSTFTLTFLAAIELQKATVASCIQKVFHHVSITDGEPLWPNIYL